MLVNANRAIALRLLQEANLLEIVLPESVIWFAEDERRQWLQTQAILAALERPSFATALAATVRTLRLPEQSPVLFAETICRRWKLANEERDELTWLLQEEATIRSASQTYWPKLQRVLVDPRANHLLTYVAAIASIEDSALAEVEFCREKRRLPPEVLDPLPLLSGEDLKRLGIAPGPLYRDILTKVRDAQLQAEVTSPDAALQLAGRLADGKPTT